LIFDGRVDGFGNPLACQATADSPHHGAYNAADRRPYARNDRPDCSAGDRRRRSAAGGSNACPNRMRAGRTRDGITIFALIQIRLVYVARGCHKSISFREGHEQFGLLPCRGYS
jgi:hypothetical protein